MKIAIRADASPASGSGHITRCLTLAHALRERGADVVVLRGADRPAAGQPFSWSEDAEQTAAAIHASGATPDWLVVDHYGIDHRWEQILRANTRRLMVIDDLADRRHECDLLVDQNLVARMNVRYAGKLPATCVGLYGPTYALLQPIYAELHERVAARAGTIRRLLVFTSGADPDNVTGRILAAFLSLERDDIAVDVVLAADSPHTPALREQASGRSNVHLECGLPSLAPLMARADLAIGAAGVTTWERLCLGLPSLVITMASNQRATAEELHRQGLVRWLGDHDAVEAAAIADVLGDLIGHGLDADWSNRCRAVVDGQGAPRVCAAMGLA